MTILSIVIALAALVGIAAIWLRLKMVEKTVAHLERLHETSEVEKDGNLKGLPFAHSLLSAATVAGKDLTLHASVSETLIILGYRDNLFIELGNQPNSLVNAFKEVRIEVPPGTTHVVPSLTGFVLIFGTMVTDPDGTTASVNIKGSPSRS